MSFLFSALFLYCFVCMNKLYIHQQYTIYNIQQYTSTINILKEGLIYLIFISSYSSKNVKKYSKPHLLDIPTLAAGKVAETLQGQL